MGSIYVLLLFMSGDPDRKAAKRERAEQRLEELAELSLMLAREAAVQARQAEDPAEKTALTDAFERMSRSLRLTLALDFKLQRDAERDDREAAREAKALADETVLRESRILAASKAANVSPVPPTPVEVQRRRVRDVLNRLIWNEAEGDHEDYDVLVDDLDTRLDEIQHAPGFAEMPIEVLAATLAQDMKLSGELVITTALPPLRSGGGGPLAERSEERGVQGASHTHSAQPRLADTG
ncbi:MAG: hypothetical protein JSS35_13810, partial [Proteobacteria bacterium]|nr:hypothetical protein [Pseudomonadota bacterium]